ncbi:Trm112 family protein [Nocardioides nanhaiensis]|uniref:UPF0434 protein GCM10023226_11900 n=1 Tax=Nocardioides nanhaiensis TaxID=1476871 RepID=A0ABP8VZL5_9ACTN
MTENPQAGQQVDPALLEIIVCPACRAELDLVAHEPAAEPAAELVCRGCGLAYPVRDGIPVLLVDEARKPA